MRKQFCFLILAASPVFAANSLFEARGFVKDKCYRHPAQVVCDQKKQCSLNLFTHSTGALSFNLIGFEEDPSFKLTNYFLITFKLKESGLAEVLEQLPLDQKNYELRNKDQGFQARATKCLR